IFGISGRLTKTFTMLAQANRANLSLRRLAAGISGSLTKTFTMLAQASDAGRWVRASPQKKLKNNWTI
ncbi:MAG: hypothetical protein MPK08_03985, partial [Alphaproteobacteria bacterium]|nr:hypothetical protein [Alphaproteobacteria bacterium]